MQLKFKLLGLLIFLGANSLLFAQTSVANTDLTASIALMANENAFFEDVDGKTIYIDFETVKVNLSDIKVKNENGEVVLKDELWSLPVNTIYELDYSQFQPGNYEIELRSFTGILKKSVSVK